MFTWFRNLFRAPASPVMAALTKSPHAECPDCGHDQFNFGPHGGLAQMIKCANCGAEFRIGPFDDGWCGTPMMAERVEPLTRQPKE